MLRVEAGKIEPGRVSLLRDGGDGSSEFFAARASCESLCATRTGRISAGRIVLAFHSYLALVS